MIVVVLSPAPEAEENHFGKENDAMQDAQKAVQQGRSKRRGEAYSISYVELLS